MLKDHKYFHFRPFSDEINDLLFFKSPKTLFGDGLTFWVFSQKYWFFQIISSYHIWVPPVLTSSTVSKKANERILWKVCLQMNNADGQTRIQMTLLHGRRLINFHFELNLPVHLLSPRSTPGRPCQVQAWLGMSDHT